MRAIVKMALICFVALSISGCCDKGIEIIRPKLPSVQEANITLRCDDKNDTFVAKCVMRNYLSVKQERDGLRAVINQIGE